MNINIRHENEMDFRKVEEVTREAFYNLYFPGCNEHLVVHNIRNHRDYIKELSYIIEIDGEIVGSIFYTHSKIVGWDGSETKTISFGPVSIHPKYHRMGLGRKLITHSIEEAKRLGYSAILNLGYPYHYEPYGFLGGKKYNIAMEDGNFYIGLLVLPLYKDALKGISGYAKFSDVYEVTEEETEKFDSTFPKKERCFKESQREFEIASTMIDE
ncbi:N-acetyltransferase [uncultured Ilyobacter sp.]|uniref:GNAT family N-acetyltransferase n=1 Tax=uncultured Ilyobacter sp. TaxID=544433 RepID=UPI0029C69DBB|nr:N-acetyltransferase [uncultured Ilyobacter sp.]